MVYYLSYILSLLGMIAWIISIKFSIFRTNWVYILFIFTYILSILNYIFLIYELIISKQFNILYFWSFEDYMNVFLLNITTYIYIGILGVGLIVIKLIPYSINKMKQIQIRTRKKLKETNLNEELIAIGTLYGFYLELKDDLEEHKKKKKV